MVNFEWVLHFVSSLDLFNKFEIVFFFICEYISITDPFYQSDIASHIKNLNASVLSHLQHCPAFLSWIKLMFNSIESLSNIFHLLIKS